MIYACKNISSEYDHVCKLTFTILLGVSRPEIPKGRPYCPLGGLNSQFVSSVRTLWAVPTQTQGASFHDAHDHNRTSTIRDRTRPNHPRLISHELSPTLSGISPPPIIRRTEFATGRAGHLFSRPHNPLFNMFMM